MDHPIFYIFLFIHLVSLVVAFGSVIVVDTFGLLWLLKWWNVTLERVTGVAEITQRLIWLGWCGLVVSGLGLISMKGYIDNLTKIKLFFVLMIGLNGIFLHLIKKSMERLGESKNVPKKIMFRIGLASFISQLGWWGAMSIGFVHRHIQHNIPWPANWIGVISAIIMLIALIALIGELVTNKQKPN